MHLNPMPVRTSQGEEKGQKREHREMADKRKWMNISRHGLCNSCNVYVRALTHLHLRAVKTLTTMAKNLE